MEKVMETMYIERLHNENGEWVWKSFGQNYDTEADFSMDEDNLNTDICKMGQLMVKYGTLAAEQSANLSRKEEHVKLTKASLSAAFKSQAEVDGTKLTIPDLADKVTIHATYQQALSELHILRADSLKADHWWRAIVKKADLLTSMAYRQSAELKRMPG
jgi:hypothetical protein